MRRLVSIGAAALVLAGGFAASSAEAYPWVVDWRERMPVQFTPVPGVVVPVHADYGPPGYGPGYGGYGPGGVCYVHRRVWSEREGRRIWVTEARPC